MSNVNDDTDTLVETSVDGSGSARKAYTKRDTEAIAKAPGKFDQDTVDLLLAVATAYQQEHLTGLRLPDAATILFGDKSFSPNVSYLVQKQLQGIASIELGVSGGIIIAGLPRAVSPKKVIENVEVSDEMMAHASAYLERLFSKPGKKDLSVKSLTAVMENDGFTNFTDAHGRKIALTISDAKSGQPKYEILPIRGICKRMQPSSKSA